MNNFLVLRVNDGITEPTAIHNGSIEDEASVMMGVVIWKLQVV
jgi:hypothetical protein